MSRGKRDLARFLFLEFLDPEINTLLSSLRRTFDDRESNTGIHITIRGPYYEAIRGEDIRKYEKILCREPILIHGIDMFRNPDEVVVFIRVHSVALSEVWWKPDFPKERYGFNPHISLFKSKNVELALAVLNFLKKEELKLISHKFRLIPFSSRQMELFPYSAVPKKPSFSELANRRLVRPDILRRAAGVVEGYREECVEHALTHAT